MIKKKEDKIRIRFKVRFVISAHTYTARRRNIKREEETQWKPS